MCYTTIKIHAEQLAGKLAQKKTQLENLEVEEARATIETLVVTYEAHIVKLETAEQKAIAALKSSVVGYEKLKLKVSLLEEQIDLARTMASVESSIKFDDTSAEVNKIIEEMNRDLDLAEASLAVQALDLDLQ